MRSQFECNVTWFCLALISLVHMHGAVVVSYFVGEGGEVRSKLDVEGQKIGKISDVDEQGVRGS